MPKTTHTTAKTAKADAAPLVKAPESFSGVTITDDGFDPATYEVKVGTPVNWFNGSSHVHSVEFDPVAKGKAGDVVMPSGDITSGSTYSHTFTIPGSYTYHCGHDSDMKGAVKVS